MTDHAASTGLREPRDIDAWRRTHGRRRALSRLGPRRTERATLLRSDPDPVLLVVVDNVTRTAQSSLLAPIPHLAGIPLAVLAPSSSASDVIAHLPATAWERSSWEDGDPLPTSGVVLASGEIGLGAQVLPAARRSGGHTVVVQHGILTPDAPPLPASCTALTWSEHDSRFWRSGREDVTTAVVGGQLAWEAARTTVVRRGQRPVFLGQLHSAELPRRQMARAAEEFCVSRAATYRPHPAERDRRSRTQHARWERAGIEVDRADVPLLALGRPVAGVFSTGLLEARAAGLPVEVTYPDPPRWLRDLWRRYELDAPAGPPGAVPADEPAALVAGAVTSLLRHNGLL